LGKHLHRQNKIKPLISHFSGNPTVLNVAKKRLLKCKYKEQYITQNNSVLKFRNASDETKSSAIYEIIKNGIIGDSKFLRRYDVSRDVSKDQEVQLKLYALSSQTCSRKH
jgi:hypothetical protein